MSLSSYMLTPGLDPRLESMRKRAAYALLAQGSSGEPIKHWTQGLARMAQGALGGYELYKEKQDEDAREAKIAGAIDDYPGMRDAPQAAPGPVAEAPPAPVRPRVSPNVVAALGGPVSDAGPVASLPPPNAPINIPRQEVMPSAKVWGDKEAEAAGLYETPAAPQSRVASAFAALPQGNPAAEGAMTLRPVQTEKIAQALSPRPNQPTIQAPVIPPQEQQQIRTLWANPATRPLALQKLEQYSKPKDQVVPLTDPAERARYGIKPEDTTPYQKDATGKITPVNPQPFQVNVNQQAESEFSKEAAKHQAKRFDDLAGEATTARQMQSDVAMLRDLGEKIRTGKMAEVKAVIGPYADALGIKVDGLNEIQAFEAVVNRVAPQMRVKGTGAQSDFELRNFLKQFPSIGNTPEGNAIIDKTLQGFIQNKVTAAEIGSAALTGEITRKEAEKRLRELPDPMKEWREYQKTIKATADDGGWKDMGNGVRIREKK